MLLRDKWVLPGMPHVADAICLYPPNHPNSSYKRSVHQRRVPLMISFYYSSFWSTVIQSKFTSKLQGKSRGKGGESDAATDAAASRRSVKGAPTVGLRLRKQAGNQPPTNPPEPPSAAGATPPETTPVGSPRSTTPAPPSAAGATLPASPLGNEPPSTEPQHGASLAEGDGEATGLPRAVCRRAAYGLSLTTDDLLRVWEDSRQQYIAPRSIVANAVPSEVFSASKRQLDAVECVLTPNSIAALTQAAYGHAADVFALEDETDVLIDAIIKRGRRVRLAPSTLRAMTQVSTCDEECSLAQSTWRWLDAFGSSTEAVALPAFYSPVIWQPAQWLRV